MFISGAQFRPRLLHILYRIIHITYFPNKLIDYLSSSYERRQWLTDMNSNGTTTKCIATALISLLCRASCILFRATGCRRAHYHCYTSYSQSVAIFWTRKPVPKRDQRWCCCCCCWGSCCYHHCYQCTKAFPFHNRSSVNFADRQVTIFSTIAPCRTINLRLTYLLTLTYLHCPSFYLLKLTRQRTMVKDGTEVEVMGDVWQQRADVVILSIKFKLTSFRGCTETWALGTAAQ